MPGSGYASTTWIGPDYAGKTVGAAGAGYADRAIGVSDYASKTSPNGRYATKVYDDVEGAANPAPSFSVQPSISGTPARDSVLTGSDGTIANGTVSSRQWRRDGVAISGATGSTYTLVAGDVGTSITFAVTATGTYGTTTAVSAAVGPITAPAPSFSVQPSISGSTVQGSTLTGSDGTISNGTVASRQWKRNGANISGATGSTYVLVAGDVGATITFAVTASGAGGSTTATSGGVGPITAPPTVTTAFFGGTGNITVPAGYSSARITIYGAGGTGGSVFVEGDGTYYAGGGGGACSQGVVAVTAGETLAVANNQGDGNLTAVRRGGTTLVAAQNGRGPGASIGGANNGGLASSGTGTVKFSGGRGPLASGSNYVSGGGAAGTTSNGGDGNFGFGAEGGSAGTGATFTATAGGATATAGKGAGFNFGATTPAGNYGGGGTSNGETPAPSQIVIDWGQT